MTKGECMQLVRSKFGPTFTHFAGQLWETAFYEGERDAIPRITNFANKASICSMMLVLHQHYGMTNEQIQDIWDKTVELVDQYTIDEILDRVKSEMDVLLVDGVGNPV